MCARVCRPQCMTTERGGAGGASTGGWVCQCGIGGVGAGLEVGVDAHMHTHIHTHARTRRCSGAGRKQQQQHEEHEQSCQSKRHGGRVRTCVGRWVGGWVCTSKAAKANATGGGCALYRTVNTQTHHACACAHTTTHHTHATHAHARRSKYGSHAHAAHAHTHARTQVQIRLSCPWARTHARGPLGCQPTNGAGI